MPYLEATDGFELVDEEHVCYEERLAKKMAFLRAVMPPELYKELEQTLETGSKWTLTGDSYLSALDGDTSGIDLNGHTLYVGGVAWAR